MEHSMSYPSSPHSSALPSPPSSPGSSFSSLPSSAFSLSVPSSPPHQSSPFPHIAHSLIIPSLSLDTTESNGLSHGETLGHVKLLVLGSKGSGKTFLAETLLRGNADVHEAGEWLEEPGIGRVLCAEIGTEGELSEGTASVKLVEVAGFDQTDDPQGLLPQILEVIHSPFRAMLPLLSPTHPPDASLRDLLASPHSSFFTAALLLVSSPPTPLENTLLTTLSTHIPVLPVPSLSLSHTSRSSSRARTRPPRPPNSSLRPLTLHHLHTTLFRRPAALRTLRLEAAERFLWWREVENAKQQPGTLDTLLKHEKAPIEEQWDWEAQLSRDVTLAREEHDAQKRMTDSGVAFPPDWSSHSLDPLHVPSLFLFSLSLFRPLRDSLVLGVKMRWWAVTVVGAFCAGVGMGWLFGRM